MDNYESCFDGKGFFDELSEVFSKKQEAEIDVCEKTDAVEVKLESDSLEVSEILENLKSTFEGLSMEEHLCSVDLLGSLSHTDMLMYYCIVMDSLALYENQDQSEQQPEIMAPKKFIEEKEKLFTENTDITVELRKDEPGRLTRILRYLKNKEFRVLSNTFYLDGSDFLMFLLLKSVVGYNLRLKIVIKCNSDDEATALKILVQGLEINSEE